MGIGLPLDLPAPVGGIELPEIADGAGTPARRFIGPLQLGLLFGVCRVKKRPGFNDGHFQPGVSQHLGSHAASGAGAHDHGVVHGWVFFDLHGIVLVVRYEYRLI